MARVKIQLADNIKRVVVVDTEATRGATIGTNVYNADGSLYVPASGGGGSGNFRAGYGILFSGGTQKTISVNRAADFAWQGQHSWEKPLWVPHGTASLPAVAWADDPDTGPYRVGADNYGIAAGGVLRWDVNASRTYQTVPIQVYQGIADNSTAQFLTLTNNNTGATDNSRLQFSAAVGASGLNTGWQLGIWADVPGAPLTPPDVAGTGFRWANALTVANQPDLVFYTHDGSANGAEVYRHRYSTAQMLFVAGSAAAPTVAVGALGTGFYWNAADSRLSMSIGGLGRFGVAADHIRVPNQIRASAGAAAAPIYSFQDGQNMGLYYIGTNNFGLSVGGTLRWDINTARINFTLPHQGPAGSAGTPTYSASGDPNTGMYLPGSDVLAFATAGTLRYQYGAAGQLGIGGANYGAADTQAIVSGGASAAPSWQTVLVDGQTQTLGGAKTWTGLHTFSELVTLNPNSVDPPPGAVNADAALLLANSGAISIQQLAIGANISAGYRFVTAGGSYATPTAVSTAEVNYMAYLGAGGFDGTNWQTGSAGLLGVRPAGTWSGTSRPTRLVAESTAVGSTTRRVLLALDNALMEYGNATDNPAHTFHGQLVPNAQTLDASAGALSTYWEIAINGTTYKIPLHADA